MNYQFTISDFVAVVIAAVALTLADTSGVLAQSGEGRQNILPQGRAFSPITEAEATQTDGSFEECTIGAASGRATKDGRPMIWKTRDASGGNNAVYFNTTKRCKFLAVIDAGSRSSSWMALNEKGFGILNSIAYDLASGPSGLGNGTMMTFAAGTCVTVADFQHLLDSTNATGRQTYANFVVMDSTGAAAVFETGGSEYWKFDATDSVACPKGYLLRTNFSVTGAGSVGAARHRRTTSLFEGFSAGDSISPKTVIRHQMRDFADPSGVAYAIPFNGTVGGAPYGFIDIQETICRLSSVSATVIQGVLPGELARTSTFWTILGCPGTGIAVPYWPVGDPPLVSADLPKAVLNTLSNDIYDRISGAPTWSSCINTQLLRNSAGGGILHDLFQVEDLIFAAADTLLVRWRAGQYDAGTMLKAESTYAALALNGLTAAKANIVGIAAGDAAPIPSNPGLGQNYPNPFNPTTVIRYQVSGVSNVKLGVFDLLGREVAVLVNERQAAGIYTVSFDLRRSGMLVSSGVLFYRLQTNSQVITRQMVVMK